MVACLPSFGLLFPAPGSSRHSHSKSSSHSEFGYGSGMQRDGIALRSRSSQRGLHEPVIVGNASGEHFKRNARNGVLVTTTFNVRNVFRLSDDSN